MYHLYWHEPTNLLAVVEFVSSLPHAFILDEEYEGENPVFLYPRMFLANFGWHDLGEL
jgi:hypothetical protein